MTQFKATNFINGNELEKGLFELAFFDPQKFAVLADFKAKTLAGMEQVLSCFIEHDGSEFKISEIIGVDASVVDISNLQFDLSGFLSSLIG